MYNNIHVRVRSTNDNLFALIKLRSRGKFLMETNFGRTIRTGYFLKAYKFNHKKKKKKFLKIPEKNHRFFDRHSTPLEIRSSTGVRSKTVRRNYTSDARKTTRSRTRVTAFIIPDTNESRRLLAVHRRYE